VSSPADLTLAAWALLEVAVRVREGIQGKGARDRDRGTRVAIALALGAAIGVAISARSLQPLRTSLPPRAAGVTVMWLGLALRVWSIATLGDSFRTTVQVRPGQVVVASGPYRWVRHPAYAGLVLIIAGFGVAAGNWLALAACLLLPFPALAWRIRVEEAELARVLGQTYETYRRGRARLIPRVW
jgi:protein-S-isoprenylcysteine O-methyltransferase Ste14